VLRQKANSMMELDSLTQAQPAPLGPAELIAQSPSMQQVLEMARRAAQTDVGIMLLGESGVGKEVVSRFVHHSSHRAKGPFIAINCAAIPETLLEATLFGFEKGSFTGATQSAPSKFEQAQGGTLLLDEVTEMAAGLQAKLLRVLQEREIERLGGRRRIALDLRIVATSNRELQQAVKQGILREDLYYRLSVFPLRIPPLRDRREDILPLATSMLARYAGLYGLGLAPRLDATAQQALLSYHWPGNVRELENVIQRSAILCLQGVISAGDLFFQAFEISATSPVTSMAGHGVANRPQPASALRDLDAELANNERQLIADALRESHGSKKLTAERLGISPRTLRHKLQRLREAGVDLPPAHDG
jgi:two-component system response regulator FlrC